MYSKHGRYWFVKANKWTDLGTKLSEALAAYGRLVDPPPTGEMDKLFDKVLTALQTRKKPIKASTLAQYRQARKKLSPAFVEFSPHQVLGKHIAAVKMRYASTPNMANRMLSFLRVCFRYAVEWQLTASNPCIGIIRHDEHERDRYLTDTEYKAIWDKASTVTRVTMDLCYLTGQRIGDVLKIRRADLTDEGIAFTQEKTGKRLIVEWTPELKDVCEQAKNLTGNVRGLFLICKRNGRPYSYGGMRDNFSRARKLANVSDTRLHDIRAKSLTDADQQGIDAQKLGGHATRAMTERYIRIRRIDVATPPSIRQGGKK